MKTHKAPSTAGGTRTKGKRKSGIAGQPLVSIVTVVRNGEAHLEEAIRSVLDQDYRNIEYLIIDGASTDHTLEIIRRNENRIDYWVSEPDNGIYDAMNKGIALAGGDIIGILNADDFYRNNAVGRIAGAALAHPEAEVFHGNLLLIRKNDFQEIRRPRIGKKKYRPYLMPVNHPTVFVRSRCYERCGVFDPAYRTAADFDLMLRLLHDCRAGFYYLDATLACMREGGESGRYGEDTYGDIVAILEKRNLPRGAILRFMMWYRWLMLMQFANRFGLFRALAPLYYKLRRSGA